MDDVNERRHWFLALGAHKRSAELSSRAPGFPTPRRRSDLAVQKGCRNLRGASSEGAHGSASGCPDVSEAGFKGQEAETFFAMLIQAETPKEIRTCFTARSSKP